MEKSWNYVFEFLWEHCFQMFLHPVTFGTQHGPKQADSLANHISRGICCRDMNIHRLFPQHDK